MKITKGNREIIIINCYVPPRETINTALVKIEDLICKFNDSEVLIMGDFNAKGEIWGSNITDDKGEKILELIVANNLTLLNDKNSPPTFKTNRAKGWIDLTIATSELYRNLKIWEVLKTPNNSDHRYIKVVLGNIDMPEVYGLTLKGELKVLEQLRKDEWLATQHAIETNQEIENVVTTLYEKIEELTKRYSKRKETPRQKPKPWWSTDLEIERKKVRACRRRYQRAKGNVRKEYKEQYYREHDIYNKMINDAKRESWKVLSNKLTKNPFNLAYKLARNQIKKKVILRSVTKEDGNNTTSTKETIEYLLEKFYPAREPLSESETLSRKPQRTENNDTVGQHPNSYNEDIPFTELEITLVVNNLRKDVTPGPDGIKTAMIQAIFREHTAFFVNLFNACLKNGYFPRKWKQAKVILIPKAHSDEKAEEKKYRPIAINSILGKVLEKLIKDRIYFFLFKNKLFNRYQYGFTHNTSTIEALQEIERRIRRARIDKNNVLLISLDIKNAFNSIRPDIVTQKLEECKCHSNLIKITDSILRNRQIIFEEEGIKVTKELPVGSPQGSPLSPLYWNLTVAGLLETKFPDKTHVQAFADDIVVMIEFKARKEAEDKANEVLSNICKWSRQCHITLNNDKTEGIIFGKQYGSHPPSIKAGKDKVRIVNEMRILGVIFDNKLTFLPHLKYIKEKVTEVTYSLSKTIKEDKVEGRKLRQVLYKRGIERIIVYASPVWYTRKSIIVRKLRAIQRLPLLMITRAFKTTSNASLNILAKLPPLHLVIEKENEQHAIIKTGKSFKWEKEVFNQDQIMKKYDHWQNHPANKTGLTITKEEEESDYQIYTDGSKKEKEVGAAFLVFNSCNKLVLSKQFKLPEYSSNYDAEIIAIKKAIEFMVNENGNNKYQLFTDSWSALQALKNPLNTNAIINEIRAIIKANSNVSIKLSYVKAHSNSLGNNLADEHAKVAARTGEQCFIPITKAFISKQLQVKVNQEWNLDWSKEGKESYTYNWIKNVNLIPEHFPTNFYSSQAITGHGRFPFYFARFKITQTNKCKCNKNADSFDHYLRECPLVLEERRKLIAKLGDQVENRKPEIIKKEETQKILEEIVLKINDFILQA